MFNNERNNWKYLFVYFILFFFSVEQSWLQLINDLFSLGAANRLRKQWMTIYQQDSI